VIVAALVTASLGLAHHQHVDCSPVCEHRVNRHMRYVLRRTHRRQWRQITRPFRDWLRSTRMCESRGDYRINTGNGFYGAYQFTLESWQAVGGVGLPSDAEPLRQDLLAVRLLKLSGRGNWPVCG